MPRTYDLVCLSEKKGKSPQLTTFCIRRALAVASIAVFEVILSHHPVDLLLRPSSSFHQETNLLFISRLRISLKCPNK